MRRHKKKRALSEQTIAVLRARDEGLSRAQTADRLGNTPPTITHHLRRAREVLHVETIDDAMTEARSRGLI